MVTRQQQFMVFSDSEIPVQLLTKPISPWLFYMYLFQICPYNLLSIPLSSVACNTPIIWHQLLYTSAFTVAIKSDHVTLRPLRCIHCLLSMFATLLLSSSWIFSAAFDVYSDIIHAHDVILLELTLVAQAASAALNGISFDRVRKV